MSIHTDPPVQNILSELPVDQIDAVGNPQIIQRVRGAKYILELEDYAGNRIHSEEFERIHKTFECWWNGDMPFLVLRRPVRISVIVLPEVSE